MDKSSVLDQTRPGCGIPVRGSIRGCDPVPSVDPNVLRCNVFSAECHELVFEECDAAYVRKSLRFSGLCLTMWPFDVFLACILHLLLFPQFLPFFINTSFFAFRSYYFIFFFHFTSFSSLLALKYIPLLLYFAFITRCSPESHWK